MKRPRRHRGLTEGEARLWGEIAKLITPLRGRAVPKTKGAVQGAAKVPGKSAPAEPAPIAKAGAAPAASAAKPFAKAITKSITKPVPAPVQQPFAPAVTVQAPPPPKPKRPVKLHDLGAAAPVVPRPAPRAPAPSASHPGAPGLERRERRGLQRGLLPIEARIDLHGLYQAEAHAALVGFLMRSRAAGHARVLVVTGKGARIEDGFSERGVLRRSVPHWLRGAELRAVVLGFEEAARHHGGQGALYVRLRRR